MKGKVLNFMKKISIVIVCLFMIFNAMPLSSLQVSAAGEFTNVSKVSDPNTMDSWQWYFGKDANGNYSTVNAGAIWGGQVCIYKR